MKIHNLFKNRYIYISGFILLGLLAFLSKPTPEVENSDLKVIASVDTYIPRGFVLVPIEIQNADSLSSIVGELGGVVDLYTTRTPEHPGGLKVGSRLKIIRAPLNPQQYAVLVRENESHRLLSFIGPFSVVVQNPSENGAEVTAAQSKKSIQIQYHN